ncbi:LAFE_0E14224g1_1 [Lachancea fermentati]|uniref:LAFE_0E14224g1_1 n=1 Tax=Lachancea fermentati TaxID=4955 RepID=A0A1G4MDW2_LACFM|nr:LAFE_0E14224g1_1 [Lachancea fermentati]
MGLFRKSSNSSSSSGGHQPDVKLTKEDRENFKIRTASVHDPILEAVQEAQPFEQAADALQEDPNRRSYYSNGENGQHLRDVFGQPIRQPDVSNPTRARDERPLDTIRSFEYSISGDPSWSQRLETQQYGFRVRPDFPTFGNGNPYAMTGDQGAAMPSSAYATQEQAIYQAPVPVEEGKKKKKRGLFGRKKKD